EHYEVLAVPNFMLRDEMESAARRRLLMGLMLSGGGFREDVEAKLDEIQTRDHESWPELLPITTKAAYTVLSQDAVTLSSRLERFAEAIEANLSEPAPLSHPGARLVREHEFALAACEVLNHFYGKPKYAVVARLTSVVFPETYGGVSDDLVKR